MKRLILAAVITLGFGFAALGTSTPAQAQQGDQYWCCYDGPSVVATGVVYGADGQPWYYTQYSNGHVEWQCLGCYLP